MLSNLAVKGYVVAAWLFALGVVLQVFLAGMGVFAGARNWTTHVGFGYTLGWLFLGFIVFGVVARPSRSIVRWTLLLFVLYVIQTILPSLRGDVPVLAALHPVNALAVFLVALIHARRIQSIWRGSRQEAIATSPVTASTHS